MSFSQIYKKIVLDSSFENWKKFLKYYMQINKAHLLMLTKTKVLSQDISVQIARGLKKMESEKIDDSLPEQTEDLVFLVEKRLSELIGAEKAGFLHTARSRNDIDTTVFRMCVRDELIDFSYQLVDLIDTVIEKAKGNLETVVLLYTHGQPAQVSSFSHYLLAYGFDFLEILNSLIQSLQIVNLCPMGSGAITTTGFEIDRKMVSDYLGFSEPVENSYRAIVTSHWIGFPSSCLKMLMSDLTRLSQEFIHKSSCEIGIFQFPDELVQISSIMPQKRNPVILEHIRIRANTAYGLFETVERVFVNTAYQDVNENGDFVLFKFLDGVKTAKEALILSKEVLQKIDVDQQKVKDLALKTGATTTELADELVRRFKISFRQAHTLVSEYVRSGLKHSLLTETFDLTEQQLNQILSAEHFVKVRKTSGGPSKEPVLEMIKKIKDAKEKLRQKLKTTQQNIEKSFEKLESDFEFLTQHD